MVDSWVVSVTTGSVTAVLEWAGSRDAWLIPVVVTAGVA